MRPRPTILVVEDDSILREVVSLVLQDAGAEIVLAASGEEAIAILAEGQSFSGLYTDINLPGPVDGWHVGVTFNLLWPAQPIVYASARDPESWREAVGGVFLRKPLNLDRISAALT